jgi:hypothetical protein
VHHLTNSPSTGSPRDDGLNQEGGLGTSGHEIVGASLQRGDAFGCVFLARKNHRE